VFLFGMLVFAMLALRVFVHRVFGIT